ncbi:MAG: helix-turn-helix domain-containing protein [Candidatus Binatia bacterium]|nr:helix-turn-helix domain-containing protein [Candidatus Binatia bacterium]
MIQLVEGSDLSVRRTLRELGVSRSIFYAWYERYREHGAAQARDAPSLESHS